jgi:hypothetical protein
MMIRVARPLLLNHVVSPYGIAILSTLVFLIAWVFPPGLYSDLINEPDLMFLDAETLLFFLLCVAGFWAGLLLIDFLFPYTPLSESTHRSSQLKGFALLLPLLVTTVMTALATAEIFRQIPNLLTLLSSQEGGALRDQMGETLGALGWGANAQVAVLWWTYWILSNSRPRGSRHRFRDRRFVSWLIFAFGLIVQTAYCIVRVARGDLMPVLAGLAILYLLGKIKRRELTTPGLLRSLMWFSLGIVLLFSIFGILRGTTDASGGLQQLAGYTIASYNRLTAILRGKMRYPYGGHGVYLFMFLTSSSVVHTIIPVREIFGWPTFYDLWKSEFQAPQLAGLNPVLIWAGTFGYIFSDFGWVSPLILTTQGVFYGLMWREAKAGTVIGVTIYPWFGYCALCWFSTNTVFDYRFPFIVATGLLLMGYEKLLSVRIPRGFSTLRDN